MDLSILPSVNAGFNALSAVFLLAGFISIRRKKINFHKACMVGALVASFLFLASYLTYHYFHGTSHFPGRGWIRPVYFTILISHTILAIVIVPMVFITLRHALKERFDKHRALARWTFPLWLYVSITGVIIYLLLYHAYRN